MTLEEFRRQRSLTFSALAILLQIRGAHGAKTVHRYALHQRMPAPSMLRRITIVTKGEVTANDFLLPPPRISRLSAGPQEASA